MTYSVNNWRHRIPSGFDDVLSAGDHALVAFFNVKNSAAYVQADTYDSPKRRVHSYESKIKIISAGVSNQNI